MINLTFNYEDGTTKSFNYPRSYRGLRGRGIRPSSIDIKTDTEPERWTPQERAYVTQAKLQLQNRSLRGKVPSTTKPTMTTTRLQQVTDQEWADFVLFCIENNLSTNVVISAMIIKKSYELIPKSTLHKFQKDTTHGRTLRQL
jgi:hypothetical protein